MTSRSDLLTRWKKNYLLKESDYTDLLNSIWMQEDGVLIYSESIIDITYENLLNLVNTSTLELNKLYRITNYVTRHLLPQMFRGDVNSFPTSWNLLSPIEPIIVKARTTNKLYREAFSESHPNDIIEYVINPVDYDQSAYGKITFRKDTTTGNSAYFDFRNVRVLRWETINNSGIFDSVTNTNNNAVYMYAFPTNSTNVTIDPYFVDGYNVPAINNIVFQNGGDNITVQSGCSNLNFIEKISTFFILSGVTSYSASTVSPNSILQYNHNQNRIVKLIAEDDFNTLTTSGSNADSLHSHYQLYAHENDISNPHQTSKLQVGLGNVDNTSDINKPVSVAVSGLVQSHVSDLTNPHQTSKSQVGLGNVDNTSDANKPVSNATSVLVGAVNTDLQLHKNDNTNPHQTSKTQVGLGNVDNTSDLNKPLSTVAASAINVLNNLLTNLNVSVSGISKATLGLGNVDNTSDVNKPISTATQTLLDTKAPSANPIFVGNIIAYNSDTTKSKFFVDLTNHTANNNWTNMGIYISSNNPIPVIDNFIGTYTGYYTWSTGSDIAPNTTVAMKLISVSHQNPRLLLGKDLVDDAINSLQVTGGEKIYGNSNITGNLTVGNPDTPLGKLHIAGNSYGTGFLFKPKTSTTPGAGFRVLKFEQEPNYGTAYYISQVDGYGAYTGDITLDFLTDGSNANPLVRYDGNNSMVMIGTTVVDPYNSKFRVVGNASVSGNVVVSGTTTSQGQLIASSNTGGGTVASIMSKSSFPTYGMYCTTASLNEKVWDWYALNNTIAYRTVADDNSAASTYLQVVRSGTTVSTVSLPSGNVLVGTTTATSGGEKLQVVGNVSVSGTAEFGNKTDKSFFETDGTLRFDGNATVWDDVSFPIVVRSAGATTPPVSAVMGSLTMPKWRVGDLNVCEIQEFPHKWKEGTPVTWHCHIITSTTVSANNYLNFELEYMWANRNSVMVSNTVSSGDLLVSAGTSANTHMIMDLYTFTPSSGKIAAHIKPKLKRIASTGTGLPDPFCEMLQLHIEMDTIGSRQITSK